ncbi:TPA: ead/Ea22-like family protein [Klebsiella pneumoniae]|nr:ead/Ea22-like family protein [Klebsiella pneumoniae]
MSARLIMTTDITELAQSLKAAADREMICRDVAETSEIWERTVTPENILALVEALEYYKSREERVTSLVRDNSKSWDELYRQVEAKGKRNVELVEALASEKRICATWRKTAEANSEKLEKAQQRIDSQREYYEGVIADGGKRIAELESRTVKLPKPISVLHRREFTAAHCAIYAYPEAEVNAALDGAGIKWEAE